MSTIFWLSPQSSKPLPAVSRVQASAGDAAVPKLTGCEVGLDEIGIDDLRDQKIISFSRQNLSYTKRYFAEMFAEHDLARNIAYSCDDNFALISLVSAGLGIGFAPQWTRIPQTAISSFAR